MSVSLCLYISWRSLYHPSIYLSILSTYLSICLSFFRSNCLTFRLSIHPTIHPFICYPLPMCSSNCLSIGRSIDLSICNIFMHPCIHIYNTTPYYIQVTLHTCALSADTKNSTCTRELCSVAWTVNQKPENLNLNPKPGTLGLSTLNP